MIKVSLSVSYFISALARNSKDIRFTDLLCELLAVSYILKASILDLMIVSPFFSSRSLMMSCQEETE